MQDLSVWLDLFKDNTLPPPTAAESQNQQVHFWDSICPNVKRRGRPADYHHGLRYPLSDIATYGELSLAGRISFTNRAPLLWNMLPREVQTSSSMLVFKKKVLSLLDCPYQARTFCRFVLETLSSNYFSSFLFRPFRVGPLDL